MANRLFEKGYWELTPKNGKAPVTTPFVTRKAAVAIGTKSFGLGVGMDIKEVGQFIERKRG